MRNCPSETASHIVARQQLGIHQRIAMSLFDRHLAVAKQYGVLVGTVVLLIGFYINAPVSTTLLGGIIAAVLGLTSALLPDIDHHASKPRDISGRVTAVSLLVGTAALPIVAPQLVQQIGQIAANVFQVKMEQQALGLLVILFLTVAGISVGGSLFDTITTHRGITHSPIFAAGLFVAYYILLGTVTANAGETELIYSPLREITSVAGAGGVFAHILEDR